MRGIQRSTEPPKANLPAYRSSGSTWSALAGARNAAAKKAYRALIVSLQRDFSRLCAYCEQKVPKEGKGKGTVDHFRPRNPVTGTQQSNFGDDLTFDWLNLMYACANCQRNKDNKWPGTLLPNDEMVTTVQLAASARVSGWAYAPVSTLAGYVDPNSNSGQNAEDCFGFDNSGHISPSSGLQQAEKSKALRTMFDLGLDTTPLRLARDRHLKNLRDHIRNKGTLRAASELRRQIDRHRDKDKMTLRDTAYGPPVQFTAYVLHAYRNGWVP